jgi:hypothetical protein
MKPMLEPETIVPYCIFTAAGHPKDTLPVGIDNRPVAIVTRNGLSAAVSRIAGWNAATDTDRILRFCKVVESLHHDRTVIPVRYGSSFQEESQLLSFLEKHSPEFHALLRELHGRTEIGVRLLLPRIDEPTSPAATSTSPGRAYLMSCKAACEAVSRQDEGTIAEILRSLDGLFVRHKREDRFLPEWRVVSLYFLVSRESVKPFAEVFQKIARRPPVKLLMTGPWAPYNFVQADSAGSEEVSKVL